MSDEPQPYLGTTGRVFVQNCTIAVVPEPEHFAAARRDRQFPRPPPGLEQTLDDGTLELVLPWASNTSTSWLLFVGFFTLLPLLGGAVSSLIVILALCGVYYLAHIFVNRTTLRISGDTLEIRHGPLPSRSASRSVALDTLEGLQVESYTSVSYRMGFVVYALRTRQSTLLEHWTNREMILHVMGCIEVQRERAALGD